MVRTIHDMGFWLGGCLHGAVTRPFYRTLRENPHRAPRTCEASWWAAATTADRGLCMCVRVRGALVGRVGRWRALWTVSRLREKLMVNPLAALHMAAWCTGVMTASGLEWRWCVGKCLGPLERTAKSISRATLIRHADCDVKAAGGSLITELQRERRHAVIRGAVRRKRSWDALGAR